MRGIVGTAGHIDHGKTALIGALTGEQTDRLPEEQERGISIDLGFTHLDTRHGVLGVIDVPGHEDFIRNMLAGATGIDLLLLVVAADEGVMPQTREHVAIAELLGVHRAVVALTKTDLVDDAWLALVRDDVAGFLADTPFAGAPVVPTSATAGTGIPEVRAAIEDVFEGTRGRADDLFRLPIDRTFTVRGTGTVVTGTVWSGRLEADTEVRLLPGGPEARVRGLQVHGGEVAAVEAGQRAAVALAGIERDQVERGMTLAGPGWTATEQITATMRLLTGTGWSLEPWQRVRVHVGTAEVMARAVLLEDDRIGPGGRGLVQLRLEAPVVARAGDRFVIRSYSPVTTIGGGVVVEPLAPRRTRVDAGDLQRFAAILGDDDGAAIRALLAHGGGAGLEVATLPLLAGRAPGDVAAALDALPVVRVGGRAYPADAAAAVRTRLVDAVDGHHRAAPLRPGMDPEALRRAGEAGRAGGADAGPAAHGAAGAAGAAARSLVAHVLDGLLEEGTLVMRRGAIGRPGFEPSLGPDQEARRDAVLAVLADAGVAAPRVDELRDALDDAGPDGELEDLLALLEARGRVVRVQHDLFVERAALDAAIARIRDRLGGGEGLSPGDFRDVLGISRRHLIPILEHLDRIGVTSREGDGRRVDR